MVILGSSRRVAGGGSLVEVVVALAVLGVMMASLYAALSRYLLGTVADAAQQQAWVLAQSMMAEIQALGVAATDPDGGLDRLGPEPGEARGSALSPLDHVNDYDGWEMAERVLSFDGTPLPAFSGYRVAVTVQPQTVGVRPVVAGWWLRVSVTPPTGATVLLEGFRATGPL